MIIVNPDRWKHIPPEFRALKKREEFGSEQAFIEYYDSRLLEDLHYSKMLRKTVACPVNVPDVMEVMLPSGIVEKQPYMAPLHQESEIAFACRHCREQDPVNPCGIVALPNDVSFLCTDCYRLVERGKLDFGKDLIVECGACVADFLKKLFQTHPDRFRKFKRMKSGR